MARASSTPAPEQAGRAHDPLRFRSDIQGLRALAVLAVVAYHAGVPGISGGFVGVDFFFVLSGFLITGLLVGEHARHGRISLRQFWARRARRLLPASGLVLIATGAACAVWLPVLERRAVAVDLVWAALFGANWRFAQQQTDYLAQDRSASPFLHYWSLGVEEQFYVVWPLLVVALGALAVRSRLTPRGRGRLFVATFAGLAAVSFLWSLVQTATSQPWAFFGTPARAWQLAAGAVLVVAAHQLRVGRAGRQGMALLGVAGLLVSLVVLSEAGAGSFAYPGWLALVPTVSAALLLTAGGGPEPILTDRVLAVRPLQVIGNLSYSWYLWHWPVLVLLPHVVGSDGWPWRTLAVALSFVLSWLTYRYVENPLRSAPFLAVRPARSLLAGAVAVGLACTPALVLAGTTTSGTVLARDGHQVTLRPNPVEATSDVFSMRARGCDLDYAQQEVPVLDCTFGGDGGGGTVLLTGDSHAVAAFPGLERAAESRGWTVHSWTKSACPVADVTKWDSVVKGPFVACDAFRSQLRREAERLAPDVVVLAMAFDPRGRIVDRDSGEVRRGRAYFRAVVAGLRDTIRQYQRLGIEVVLVHDLPRAPFDPTACLVEERAVEACSVPRPRRSIEDAATRDLLGVRSLDLRDGPCRRRSCDPVVGDVLVYRDTNHITRTYSLSLAPRWESILRDLG